MIEFAKTWTSDKVRVVLGPSCEMTIFFTGVDGGWVVGDCVGSLVGDCVVGDKVGAWVVGDCVVGDAVVGAWVVGAWVVGAWVVGA